ncbi:hypothetical protein PoMZ_06892 [Pyricularia oryzae]|uniref:Aldehyde dehydrogenase domain-containing protein n=1 Tax=Pyricularia oryzae TaxID=318829 RepID=A0A4P7NTF6_PYROR|nr:hypothetical protein PoMZ_06892 [Pyricularia oryzae]
MAQLNNASTYPSTLDENGKCPGFSEQEPEAAISAGHAAFATYRGTTARNRARLLRKWYELMLQHADDFATIITLENGKLLAHSRNEILYAASFLEWFSEEAPRVYGDIIQASNPGCRAQGLDSLQVSAFGPHLRMS